VPVFSFGFLPSHLSGLPSFLHVWVRLLATCHSLLFWRSRKVGQRAGKVSRAGTSRVLKSNARPPRLNGDVAKRIDRSSSSIVAVRLRYSLVPSLLRVCRDRYSLTMGAVLTRLLEVFWTKKLDIVVIGLENR
jgi:hypothetical protein